MEFDTTLLIIFLEQLKYKNNLEQLKYKNNLGQVGLFGSISQHLNIVLCLLSSPDDMKLFDPKSQTIYQFPFF